MLKQALRKVSIATLGATLGLLVSLTPAALALGSQQNPQSGSTGVEGTIPSPAPTQAGTIVAPANGQVFTSTPITVRGLCPTGLLIKVFSNSVFVGSVQCVNGN